jgi:Tannase-like family of unknown function (DUF6351)
MRALTWTARRLARTAFFLALLLAGAARAQATRDFQITTLSSRPDMVSGDSVLLRIDVPQVVPVKKVTVTFNGIDVTGMFRADENARTLTGLLDTVKLGQNTLFVDSNGEGNGRPTAQLNLVAYPITGPIFSGPQEQPFICESQSFPMPGGLGRLGAPIDASCSIKTRVDFVYRASDGTFKALNSLSYPSDLTSTTTATGTTVPYIVRLVTGTVNRAIYQIAVLHDPVKEQWPDPFTRPAGWNGRLIYTFGGGCTGGWYRQGASTGGVLDDVMLRQGYAVASASLNVYGNNCNDVIASETMMMTKEAFIKTYGPPQYTLGFGCSGGSYQQHQIADNYPGLLDGIIPGCSFPEVLFGTVVTITDAHLLNRYFALTKVPISQDQQRLVSGFLKWESIENLAQAALRVDPLVYCPSVLPKSMRYDPVTNTTGARCDVYDHYADVFGRDPGTGLVRRPLDNVGVQYGLVALNEGAISKDQFLDMNEKIGGYDKDANFVAQRTAANAEGTRISYQTGRLTNGGGGMRDVPIIDYRAYADDQPLGDLHMRFHSFSMRDRLKKANGDFANHIMVVEDFRYGYYSSASPLLQQAINQMDRWIAAVQADTSSRSQHEKVVAAKPSDLQESCFTRDATPQQIVEEQTLTGGKCNSIYPVSRFPRLVAGGPMSNDIIKCQLKPIDFSEYKVTFTADEQSRLQKIFPDGVCDWSKPGVEQQGLSGTWISFGPAPQPAR